MPYPTKPNSESLYTIKGTVPSATDFPDGCHFHPRCEICEEKCREEKPVLESTDSSENHKVRCWVATQNFKLSNRKDNK